MLTHPLDDGVRDLYRKFGFEHLAFDLNRGMAVRIVDLARAGIGGAS